MEMESGIKELVVAVGGKMKDESMKMNRGDYDDVMGLCGSSIPIL